MKIKTFRESWEDDILNNKEMIKYFQSIIEGKPIELKALKFIDPEGNNIQGRIDGHHEYDNRPQDSIDRLLSDIKNINFRITNFDYWERNKDTKKILQKATKEIKKLIKDKIQIIKEEKPENIFTPLKRTFGKGFDYYPYIFKSIEFFERNNSEMKKIDEKYKNLFEDKIGLCVEDAIGLCDYASNAERESYITKYENISWAFIDGWETQGHYIEAFLSLPAEYIWTKYFHPLKNIKKYCGDGVIHIFSSQADYDKHDPPPLAHHYKDPRIIAWVRWYKVNILKLVGSFKKKARYYEPFKRVMKGRYKDGEMHGPVETYESGKLVEITDYSFGVKHGKTQDYRVDGTLRRQSRYVNGEEIKEEIYFDEAGLPLQGYIEHDWGCSGNYVNGKRQGEFITKNDKGKIIRKANFKDGMQDGLEFTSSEGLLREYSQEVNYKKGKRHGVEKIFDKKGAIIKKTNYVNNLKHGDSIEFYPSGRVRCVNKYVKGLLRSWKDYKDEGSITRPL